VLDDQALEKKRPVMQITDALEAYSVSLLRHKNLFLLLQRSPNKEFAPGRWTGVGGHVEMNEYSQLRYSALREVQEETGILPQDIGDFVLRRALLVSRPFQPLRVVLYFTGVLNQIVTPACPEGILSWKQAAEFQGLDIIETTRPVLDLLIADMDNDPNGMELPKTGIAVFNTDAVFQREIWAG
jgi:8-oxo-dGTP diphosphatase